MASARERQFDLAKGVCILAVIGHHVTSNASRKYLEEKSAEWWVMMAINRLSHIAVPVFLFLSALLIARSMAKRPDEPTWQFYRKRVPGVLWPYLVWTGLYVAFRLFIVKNDADVFVTTKTWPLLGEVQGPGLLVDPHGWVRMLTLGKSYFHVYFMAVLLQTILAFPLLAWAARQRLSWWPFLLAALALQWVWYFVQGNYIDFSSPGSLFPSYIAPILVGAWLGLRWKSDEMPKTGPVALAGLLVAAGYLWAGMARFAGVSVTTTLYNMLYMASACLLGLALLAVCEAASGSKRNGWLERAGEASLGLYFVHPVILYFTGGPKISGFLSSVPLPALVLFLLVTLAAAAILAVLVLTRADKLIFGRPLVSSRVKASSKEVGPVPS